jgi:hypothetical protein
MAIILKQFEKWKEEETPSLLPIPLSEISYAKLGKLAKSLDVCGAFDAPSPAKLSRIASKGGSHMYSVHSDPPVVGSELPGNSRVLKQLRRERSRNLWKRGLLFLRASVRIAKGAERVQNSHTGLSLEFDDMDLVLGSSSSAPVPAPKKVAGKKGVKKSVDLLPTLRE